MQYQRALAMLNSNERIKQMKLSQKIVYMRKKRSISQEQLAKRTGVSRQAVYKWEAGINAPELDKIYTLAEIFGISYDLLLNEKIDLEEYFSKEENSVDSEQTSKNNAQFQEKNESMQVEKARKRKLSIILTIVIIALIAFTLLAVLIYNNASNDDDYGTESNTSTNTEASSSTNSQSNTDSESNTSSSTNTDVVDTNTSTNTDSSTDTDNSNDPPLPEPIFITITFLAGGENMTENLVVEKEVGKPIGQLPQPCVTGHIFIGWFKTSDVTDRFNPITSDTLVSEDMTELMAIHETDPDSPPVIVKFDADGGIISKKDEQRFVVAGTMLGLLPEVEKDGYTLVGWYSPEDKYLLNEQTSRTVITGSLYDEITLRAVWRKNITCVDGSTNHWWTAWQTVENATCTVPEKQEHKCSECGISEYRYKPDSFTDHSYSYEVLQETDCENVGLILRKCINCDVSEQIAGEKATGHSYVDGKCINCLKDYYTKGVIYKISGQNAYVSGYEGDDKIVRISPTYTPEGSSIEYPVTSISSIKSDVICELIIPQGVISIGKAFDDGNWSMPSLEVLRLSSSVDVISIYAFLDSNISKVYIESLKDFCEIESPDAEIYPTAQTLKIHSPYKLYLNNNLLENLHIDSSIDYIATFIFANCKSIKSLTMEHTEGRSIEMGAFMSSGLQRAQIDCDAVMKNAFYRCNDLISVDITNAKSIGDNAFGLCVRIFEVYASSTANLNPGDTKFGDVAKFAKIVHKSTDDLSAVSYSQDGFVVGYANGEYYMLMYCGNEKIIKLPRSISGSAYTLGRYFILQPGYVEQSIEAIYIPKEIKGIESSGLYTSFSIEIYCEAESKPSTWDTMITTNATVYYSQKFDY